MEHCVFCAFLSEGTDFTNCGRPCDRHDLRLRDRVGAQHPVKADAGCRNTVFHALPQTGAEYVHRLMALGARYFRIEFLDESPEVVTRTIGMYRRLLSGEVTGAQLWRELKLRHQLGVTRGALDRGERRSRCCRCAGWNRQPAGSAGLPARPLADGPSCRGWARSLPSDRRFRAASCRAVRAGSPSYPGETFASPQSERGGCRRQTTVIH